MKTAKFKKKIRDIKLTLIITSLGSIVMFVKFIDYFISLIRFLKKQESDVKSDTDNENSLN